MHQDGVWDMIYFHNSRKTYLCNYKNCINLSIILAIESSCDDTSAAVIVDGVIRSNVTTTQKVHEKYGGVVPELASRKHLMHIIPVIDAAIKDADITKSDLDAIAFTRGPGLLGSLIVGVSFAKALALSLDIPMIEVNHMIAHVLAHFAEKPYPQFPFICLTVSGGHTQLLLVNSDSDMKIIGSTIDDAAGEAYDKTGKLLGLPYPAGPIIDKLAQEGKAIYPFPEPNVDQYDFSFSGIKTSIMYFLRKEIKQKPDFIQDNMHDICASVQERIVSILIKKLEKAALDHGMREIAIAGGVSANSELRKRILELGKKHGWKVHIPKFEYCTDNAGMIAAAAQFKYDRREFVDQSVTPSARLKM